MRLFIQSLAPLFSHDTKQLLICHDTASDQVITPRRFLSPVRNDLDEGQLLTINIHDHRI